MGTDRLLRAFIAAPDAAPLADDIRFVNHAQRMVYRGRPAVAPVLRAYFGEGFPDGRMRVEATLAGQGLSVVAFTFYGRQERVFMGIPATNRLVAVPMICLFHAARRHIHHIAWYYDAGTLLRQLGLAPDPAAPIAAPTEK